MSKFDIAAAVATDDRWGHMNGWGDGWMWLWGIAMMALFVVLIAWLLRAATGGTTTTGGTTQTPPRVAPTDRALEILAERYALGELTADEYRERTEQLT